jgi:hypothetical protein
MEPGGSSPHSQAPATYPYPERAQSTPDYTSEIKKPELLETGFQKWRLKININKTSITLHYLPNKQEYEATVAIFSKLKILMKTPNVPEEQSTLDLLQGLHLLPSA